MIVYLVRTNGSILNAYAHRPHADTHALTVTGAVVAELEVLDRLPLSVRDDLAVDGADEDDVTPVATELVDLTPTQPATPSAHARAAAARRGRR